MNPVYELFTEAVDCADRLTVADGASLLADAVARAREVIELPDWLPQFCVLVAAMIADLEMQPIIKDTEGRDRDRRS